MSRVAAPPTLPKAHDVVRLIKPDCIPTVEATYAELKRHYDEGGRAAIYSEPKRLVPAAFSHLHALPDLEAACVSFKNPLARECGPAILRAVWAAGSADARVKPQGISWSVSIGRDWSTVIDGDFIHIVGDQARVVWIQPRLSAAPSIAALGLLYRMFLTAAEGEGYDDVSLEILDLRQGTKFERCLKFYSADNLVVPSKAQAETQLQVLSDAYTRLRNEGYTRPQKDRQAPKGQADLFPDSPR